MSTIKIIFGAILTVLGACLITDWRTIIGLALLAAGGYLMRNLLIKQNWVE